MHAHVMGYVLYRALVQKAINVTTHHLNVATCKYGPGGLRISAVYDANHNARQAVILCECHNTSCTCTHTGRQIEYAFYVPDSLLHAIKSLGTSSRGVTSMYTILTVIKI